MKSVDRVGTTVNGFIIKAAFSRNGKYHCRTDCPVCGREFSPRMDLIVSGRCKSCGCIRIEKLQRFGKQRKKYNTYDLSGAYGIGYTTEGDAFYFDLDDFDIIKDYYWTIRCDGYIISKTKARSCGTVRMHRLIMGISESLDGKMIDHVGGDNTRNDNRRFNLRVCTALENSQNHKICSTNISGVTGVSFDATRNKWIAKMIYNKQYVLNRRYDTFEAAVQARRDAELKYKGQFDYTTSQTVYKAKSDNVD